MGVLEMEADVEVWSSLLHNNNNNTSGLLIQSSKQKYKKTSAHFISISQIKSLV